MAGKKAPGIPDVLWKLMQELKDNPHPEPGEGQDRQGLDAFAAALSGVREKVEALQAEGGPDQRGKSSAILMQALTGLQKAEAEAASKTPSPPTGDKPRTASKVLKPVLDLPDAATLREGPVELLVDRYAAIAAAARDAMEHGRVTRHNRLFDRVREIAKALAARAPDGRKALLPLLSHPDAGVREFAAHDCRDLTA